MEVLARKRVRERVIHSNSCSLYSSWILISDHLLRKELLYRDPKKGSMDGYHEWKTKINENRNWE